MGALWTIPLIHDFMTDKLRIQCQPPCIFYKNGEKLNVNWKKEFIRRLLCCYFIGDNCTFENDIQHTFSLETTAIQKGPNGYYYGTKAYHVPVTTHWKCSKCNFRY